MPLVFAAIAPHGDLAIPEACSLEQRSLAAGTQAGMRELERRCRAANPEVIVVLTPHGIHVTGSIAVVIAGHATGSLEEAPEPIDLDLETDLPLAHATIDALRGEGVPVVGVSFGGNVPAEAVMPMDWGTLIPLWYLGGRWEPPRRIVVVAPARDLPAATHVSAGVAIGRAAAVSAHRIALIASADQAHTHDAAGPYGVHPSARIYDEIAASAVRESDLGRLLDVSARLLEDAKPDSWWQMLMLHGALNATGGAPGASNAPGAPAATAAPSSTGPQGATGAWRGELLSSEAPTYYGMLCAAFVPLGGSEDPVRPGQDGSVQNEG